MYHLHATIMLRDSNFNNQNMVRQNFYSIPNEKSEYGKKGTQFQRNSYVAIWCGFYCLFNKFILPVVITFAYDDQTSCKNKNCFAASYLSSTNKNYPYSLKLVFRTTPTAHKQTYVYTNTFYLHFTCEVTV